MFRLARASAVKARAQAINQLKAVIIGADPALRETLTGLSRTALIRRCANLPEAAPTDAATATTYKLRRLAQRVHALTAKERQLQRHITAVLHTYAPQLLQRHGIGPDNAAAPLITAGDNPGPHDKRSVLRLAVRRQPDRSVVRKNPPTPPQPWR